MLIHGGDITSFKQEYPGKDWLDFSANISPFGVPSSVIQAAQKSILQACYYPDTQYRLLRDALAVYERCEAYKIVCGNGAAEVIFKLAFALRPKRSLILAPTFAEYEIALKQAGSTVDYYKLFADTAFEIQIDFIEKIAGHDLVFLCSPNNPTGICTPPKLLKPILEQCRKEQAILVVDECFMDFLQSTEKYSMQCYLQEFPNLIIMKAFTKSFAIPGLRFGYALCGSSDYAHQIQKTGPPWNVSIPAEQAVLALLNNAPKEYLSQLSSYIGEQRMILQEELQKFGFKVFQSSANYLLFYTQYDCLASELRKRGVLIRDCSNYNGLVRGYFRVAVKNTNENKQLIAIITEVLSCRKY